VKKKAVMIVMILSKSWLNKQRVYCFTATPEQLGVKVILRVYVYLIRNVLVAGSFLDEETNISKLQKLLKY
jgi:hypothetical protein